MRLNISNVDQLIVMGVVEKMDKTNVKLER